MKRSDFHFNLTGCMEHLFEGLEPLELSDTSREKNSLRPKKILVVDDQTDTLESLSLLLTLSGFNVTSAEDGREALRVLRSHPPNLLITDLNIPFLNGINLIRLIRETPNFKELPIIVITGYRSLRKMADEAGADEIVIKPADFDELMVIINRLLGV